MSQGFVGLAKKLGDAIGAVNAEPMLLANMFSLGRLERFEPGYALCQAGDRSDSVFLLVDGSIEVRRPDSAGVLRPIAVLAGPAMLGHMGVIDGSPRSATCVVSGRSPGLVVGIAADVFRSLLGRPDETGSAVRHLVLASLIRQLGNTNRTVAALLDGANERDAVTASVETSPLDSDITEKDVMLLEAVLSGWSLPPED